MAFVNDASTHTFITISESIDLPAARTLLLEAESSLNRDLKEENSNLYF